MLIRQYAQAHFTTIKRLGQVWKIPHLCEYVLYQEAGVADSSAGRRKPGMARKLEIERQTDGQVHHISDWPALKD